MWYKTEDSIEKLEEEMGEIPERTIWLDTKGHSDIHVKHEEKEKRHEIRKRHDSRRLGKRIL